jgi:RNA polymerase sigma factor (sigma-70 family)
MGRGRAAAGAGRGLQRASPRRPSGRFVRVAVHIARNRCLSELRARRELLDTDGTIVERPEIDGPASLVARREQLRELVEDIQRLPEDQRAALVLFELGDYSHAEIASVLGVRCEKVKALIFQAREGLVRGRTARESPCAEVRERLASPRGTIPGRGPIRAQSTAARIVRRSSVRCASSARRLRSSSRWL